MWNDELAKKVGEQARKVIPKLETPQRIISSRYTAAKGHRNSTWNQQVNSRVSEASFFLHSIGTVFTVTVPVTISENLEWKQMRPGYYRGRKDQCFLVQVTPKSFIDTINTDVFSLFLLSLYD